MSRLQTLDRRRALQLLGALGTTLTLPLSPAAARSGCASWLVEDLEFETLAKLGREYLEGRDGDTELPQIATLLESTAESDALERLQALMRADYANGRIISLSGWFLSVTEGRVFAVLANCA
jgi:hypothetical protein